MTYGYAAHELLNACPIGFGCSAIGNLYRQVDDASARAALDTAIAEGIRYFDTAPHYGRGLSERRVGDALRGRGDIVLSTKVGRLLSPDPTIIDDSEREGFHSPMPFVANYDYTHDGVMRSIEASLHRLGLSRIDIALVHDIGPMTHGDLHERYWCQLTGGGFDALCRLRDEGTIAAFGLGVNEVGICLDALQVAPLDVILLAGRYTLLEQGPVDDLLPACDASGVSLVIGGPFNSGILATGTRYGRTVHYDYGPAPAPIVARVARMETIAEAHGVALPAAALRFPLAHPAVASAIPGLSGADRVRQTMDWYRQPIPDDFWTEMKAEGLIRADAPVPATLSGENA